MLLLMIPDRRGRDRTWALSAYHHKSFVLESRSWRGALDATLGDKVVGDFLQVGSFLRIPRFPPPKKNDLLDIAENC